MTRTGATFLLFGAVAALVADPSPSFGAEPKTSPAELKTNPAELKTNPAEFKTNPSERKTKPTGREIMERVDARDDGDHAVQDMEMILIDKRGNRRVRKIRSYRRDWGEDTHSIMFFLTPADVKDTGFLTFDYDEVDKDDDQWLYLPALKKTKRIASSDKSGSFMGSDFTYADMTTRELDHYDYTLLKEAEVGGVAVWIVEAIPNNEDEIEETGYTKSIFFVRKDNDVVLRTKNWVKKGKATLHKTVIKASNVRFNQNLAESRFTVRQLEKGL